MSYLVSTFKQYLSDMGMDNSSTKFGTMSLRIANAAQAMMRARGRVFPWDRGHDRCVFLPSVIMPGTVNITSLSVGQQTPQVTIVTDTPDKGYVGKYIYINSRLRPYRITTTTLQVLTLAEYIKHGMEDVGGTGLSYELTDERHRLPADFMNFEYDDPNQHSIAWGLVELDVREMDRLRDAGSLRGVPNYFAIENGLDDETVDDAGNVGAAPSINRSWLRVWPPPIVTTVVDFWFRKRVTELFNDSDKFGFQDDPIAPRIVEAYGLGLLWQNDPEKGAAAANQLRIAEDMAGTYAMNAARATSGQRMAWDPNGEARPFRGKGLHPWSNT